MPLSDNHVDKIRRYHDSSSDMIKPLNQVQIASTVRHVGTNEFQILQSAARDNRSQTDCLENGIAKFPSTPDKKGVVMQEGIYLILVLEIETCLRNHLQ